jgi:hypothetical protein
VINIPPNLNKAVTPVPASNQASINKYHQANYVDTLAWANFHLGNYPKTLELLEKITDLIQPSLEVRYHLGTYRKALKKKMCKLRRNSSQEEWRVPNDI